VQLSQLGSPGQNSLVETIEQIDQSIQELRSELAAEESHLQLLTQRRDLAWDTYDALSNKAMELGVDKYSANSEVRMGSAAIPPSKPIASPSLFVTSALAGTIGLLIGIFLALLGHYMGYSPILDRRQTRQSSSNG
jgi:uncharacterized protein involved in exopolysaccharide biosynthesis